MFYKCLFSKSLIETKSLIIDYNYTSGAGLIKGAVFKRITSREATKKVKGLSK